MSKDYSFQFLIFFVPLKDPILWRYKLLFFQNTNEKYIGEKHNIILFTMSNARSVPQESAALDSSRSRIATGTTIVSSAPPARPHWSAGASSPTPKTSFARNAPSRSSCKHGAAHNRHDHL